jgi:hypothetical protein
VCVRRVAGPDCPPFVTLFLYQQATAVCNDMCTCKRLTQGNLQALPLHVFSVGSSKGLFCRVCTAVGGVAWQVVWIVAPFCGK